MRARGVIIVLAVAAIVFAAVRQFGGDSPGGSSASAPAHHDKNARQLTFAYSPEKEEMLLPLIRKFNDEHHESGGRTIEIVGDNQSSGASEAKIAAKQYRPAIWSPASSLWGRLLNFQADAKWVPDENPSLVRTPLVIALWKPEAEALGWPRKPIGFAQILQLATSKTGWAAYGLPTFGQFKLGHTNPDFSTSGLSFVVAQYYTATGKKEGLTVADVQNPQSRAKVRAIEQSIVHYGDTTLFFADQLKAHGPGYASAVAMEEVTLLDYNRTRAKRSIPLVAIYPSDGTFFSDDPMIVLDAPWVTRADKRAANVFVRWLLKRVTPEIAAKYGFRPGNRKLRAVAPIDRAHYVDPSQPRYVLGLPEPRVLATIKSAWHADRKAANVAIVVDTSGSMEDDNKIDQVRDGLLVFLRQFSPRDRVGLVTFDETVHPIVPVGEMRTNRERLRRAAETLTTGGGTAVYDATLRGVNEIEALHDRSRINAVVVLTDGEDNQSDLSADSLERQLRQRGENQEANIRVFTIAYGSDADKDVLADIAKAAGGQSYEGDPDDIAAVYKQISSFF